LNILITGQNGYIARRLYTYLLANRHDARLVDMRGDGWRHMDFRGVDSIVHLAGIVHNSSADPADFQRVNVGLTASLAQKALNEDVPQFIFVSTMAVYGSEYVFAPLNEITARTALVPKTLYGKSKLNAEAEVLKIYGGRACIVRPPTVYGENCTGNYRRLRALVLRIRLSPRYENIRGMIYVHNLCELFRLIIENSGSGIFHPQDADFLPTYKLAQLIGDYNDIRVLSLRIPFLKAAAKISDLKKAFGSLSYAPEMTVCSFGEYRRFGISAAVEQTERYWNS
jgi:UDP-glucose 4-epimerase